MLIRIIFSINLFPSQPEFLSADKKYRSVRQALLHQTTCLQGERRTIIQSLRLRSSHVPSSSLRDSEEIRAMPGARQVENPPAYKLFPKISPSPHLARARTFPSSRNRLRCRLQAALSWTVIISLFVAFLYN